MESQTIYEDFITQHQHLQIEWNGKIIFKKINDFNYGGLIKYNNLTDNTGTEVIKF